VPFARKRARELPRLYLGGKCLASARHYAAGMADALLLRIALRLNAAYSFVMGFGLIVFTERLESSLRLPQPLLTLIGSALALYGALLGALSLAPRVAGPWAAGATALDLVWVVGSVLFVWLRDVPAAAPVLVTAGIVLGCAVLQLVGLHRATFTGNRGSFAIERDVAAPVERAWTIVADVAGYAGVAETIQLPLRTLRGDFEIEHVTQSRSRIRVRFTFTAQGGIATELLLALLFAVKGGRLVGAILQRWAAKIEQTGVEAQPASAR
jgi:hypothetical protein